MTGCRFRRCLLLACVVCLMPARVGAEEGVNFTESQKLTFPTMGLPASGGSVNLTISPLNSSTSGSAQIISGVASRGQYALSLSPGGNPVSISIDITGVTTGNAGLTLDNFRGFYGSQTIDSFPSPTLPLPPRSPASTPLYIGARATANSAVTPGTYNASFSVTIFIQ